VQLLGLAIVCAFDAAFLVRYNFVLFLSRFLTVYGDLIGGRQPLPPPHHQCYGALLGQWLGAPVSLAELNADARPLFAAVDAMCRPAEFLDTALGVALSVVELLEDDPHPSVRSAAGELVKFVQRMRPLEQPRGSSAPASMQPALEPLSPRFERAADERGALCESGGDALYRVCMRQLVSGDSLLVHGPVQGVATLPQSAVKELPSTRLVQKAKWRFSDEAACPTIVAYHDRSLTVAVGTVYGAVVLTDAHTRARASHDFGARVTALSIPDWEDEPLAVVGTLDGCAYVWSKEAATPRLCFRADAPVGSARMPQLLCVYDRWRLLSARGDHGTIRLWDVEAQRVVGEWGSGASQSVTAIAVHPRDQNLCMAGFQNGLLVAMDLRCGERAGPRNVDAPRAQETILKICTNVGEGACFFAGTAKGSVIQWETLDDHRLLRDAGPLAHFDVHRTSPMCLLSPSGSYPVICDFDMKLLHPLRGEESGAVCAFHPALPTVGCVSSSGEISQYEVVSGK
jgi:regulator-associated protein of mTOR